MAQDIDWQCFALRTRLFASFVTRLTVYRYSVKSMRVARRRWPASEEARTGRVVLRAAVSHTRSGVSN
jgi:hypothetical protein